MIFGRLDNQVIVLLGLLDTSIEGVKSSIKMIEAEESAHPPRTEEGLSALSLKDEESGNTECNQ